MKPRARTIDQIPDDEFDVLSRQNYALQTQGVVPGTRIAVHSHTPAWGTDTTIGKFLSFYVNYFDGLGIVLDLSDEPGDGLRTSMPGKHITGIDILDGEREES